MEPTAIELSTLDHASRLLAQRRASYGVAIQTTVCGQIQDEWQNLLTKIEFVRASQPPPPLNLEYRRVAINRRVLSCDEVERLLERLLRERVLDTGTVHNDVRFEKGLSAPYQTRWPRSEWSTWPADVLILDPAGGQSMPQDGPLISLNAPYFPSLGQVLTELFGIRSQTWLNYFRGQVVIVLGDFRARIAFLTLARHTLQVMIEAGTLTTDALSVKLYAEGHIGALVQETVSSPRRSIEIRLKDQPTHVCVALMCNLTGDTLDEKTFKEGVFSIEPEIIVEAREPELERLIMSGEGETLEFKAKLDKGSPERIAKTAVAFANTVGGRIIFGVDNNSRVVGCEVRGLADRVTDILRSLCDPPIRCATTVLSHDDKDLLLVEVAAGPDPIRWTGWLSRTTFGARS